MLVKAFNVKISLTTFYYLLYAFIKVKIFQRKLQNINICYYENKIILILQKWRKKQTCYRL